MNRLAIAAGLAGFIAVALGAFGAHGLEGRLSPNALGWWETATLYSLAHAAGALALALSDHAGFRRAGWAFVIGAALFGGSLYAMAMSSLAGAPQSWLGMVTPLGGLAFLCGWILVVIAGMKRV